MKAIVVELKDNYAAVLSDDGCVTKIKDNNYEIGQIIQLNKPVMHLTRKISAIAATAAAFVVLGTGVWAYASPYTYVSVDVNPSLEFTVNRFDRVIHVDANNEDGEAIIKDISLKDLNNRTINKALTDTVAQITKAGYFDSQEEGDIVIATSSPDADKAEDLAMNLKQSVEQETEDSGKTVTVEAFGVGKERVEEAKQLGVTPGKLNLVKKLQEVSGNPDSVDIKEWLNKPVKDIIKATNDCKNNTKPSVETTAKGSNPTEDKESSDVKQSQTDIQDFQKANIDYSKPDKSKTDKEKTDIKNTKKESSGKSDKASKHKSDQNKPSSEPTNGKASKGNNYGKKSNDNNANTNTDKKKTDSNHGGKKSVSGNDNSVNDPDIGNKNNKSSKQETNRNSNGNASGKQKKSDINSDDTLQGNAKTKDKETGAGNISSDSNGKGSSHALEQGNNGNKAN